METTKDEKSIQRKRNRDVTSQEEQYRKLNNTIDVKVQFDHGDMMYCYVITNDYIVYEQTGLHCGDSIQQISDNRTGSVLGVSQAGKIIAITSNPCKAITFTKQHNHENNIKLLFSPYLNAIEKAKTVPHFTMDVLFQQGSHLDNLFDIQFKIPFIEGQTENVGELKSFYDETEKAYFIPGHKCILSCASPVFAKQFSSLWKNDKIVTVEYEPKSFWLVMKCIYGNSTTILEKIINESHIHTLLNIYTCAHYYELNYISNCVLNRFEKMNPELIAPVILKNIAKMCFRFEEFYPIMESFILNYVLKMKNDAYKKNLLKEIYEIDSEIATRVSILLHALVNKIL